MTTPLSPASCASASVSAACVDHAQSVAQPLHGSAGDEDGAFQRIGGAAVELQAATVVSSRWREATGSAPVWASRKQPVP